MTVFQTVADRLRGRESSDPLDWGAIYQAELPRVLNFFRYRVRDLAAAEDLTATTFEKAWTVRDRYRDEGKFSAWLMTIARNVATDYDRTRRHHLPLDVAIEREVRPEPGAALEIEEQRARLRSLVATLPPHHQELIALKYGAELTNREIARTTGMSESNVGTTLHRLVAELRSAWGSER